MNSKFFELFEYNFHFNKKLIEYFNFNYSQVPERSLKLINHILNAHQIWNSRIKNEPSFGVWQMNEFHDLIQINEANFHNTNQILENADLTQTMAYQNSVGDKFENKIEDILFHVINHSTYHRGQIALLFRESGLEPMVSDYIFYKRF